jgi:mannose-6-phosphate isomerase
VELVSGYLQTYDWGTVDGLARWAGATGTPQAELWFGTHPNGGSRLVEDGSAATVDLPILTKILAAARPLSIQVHPPGELAEDYYSRQQADPDAPRLLADPNPKAEILIALEPFEILEGFRDPAVSAAVFEALGQEFAPAVESLTRGDIPAAVRWLLGVPRETVARSAPGLPDAFSRAGLAPRSASVIRHVLQVYPDDPGVFVAAMLHSRTLAPGEAVYVDPGTVHAYVRGLGVEVMNASDNVLRLGLTTKTISVDHGLEALSVDAQPHACQPLVRGGVSLYAPPAAPFEVSVVRDDRAQARGGVARTVVCVEGGTTVDGQRLEPGQAALLAADEADALVVANGVAVVAQQA